MSTDLWTPRGTGSNVTDDVARLIEVMDTLRSPGGCPWDAEQTHASLAPYTLEETYELLNAIEVGTRADLREELGDVLLQVVFHARVAQEHATEPFSIQDVARTVADKLIERHPHVFADAQPGTMADLHQQWDKIKAETTRRESVFDGIPAAQPALARAQKILGRVDRAGLHVPLPTDDGIGPALLRLVAQARAEGIDAEAALREATRAHEQAARAAESPAP